MLTIELKSVIMGLNVTSEVKEQIITVTAVPWGSCVKHLGIKLVDLVDKNPIPKSFPQLFASIM